MQRASIKSILVCVILEVNFVFGVVEVFIDPSNIVAKTADTFVCANIDWWPSEKCDFGHCTWNESTILNLNLESPDFQLAVKLFSPFILRLGGSLQDLITYAVDKSSYKDCTDIKKVDWRDNKIGFRGGCLNMSRWEEINDFCIHFGCRIAFGLNGLYGRKQESFKQWSGDWDPSNAKSLIEYSAQRHFPIHSWQFGNELVGPSGIQCQIEAEQYADDTVKLREIIDEAYRELEKPKLATPDSYFDLDWLKAYFAAIPPGVVDIVTFHNYYLGPGDEADLYKHVLSTEWAQGNANSFEYTENAMRVLCPGCKVWMGESGGAFNSGQHLVTDSFASGFWYLDSLGLAALHNYEAFCRQTLIGGNYGLINPLTMAPNPDYYSALFFKRMMGSRVFKPTIITTDALPNVHVYAHCQKKKERMNKARVGVTLLLLNFDRRRAEKIKFSLLFNGSSVDFLGKLRREYHFKNQHLASQKTYINGIEIGLHNVRKPSSYAKISGAHELITVGAISYAFVVFGDARIAACSVS